MAWQWASCLALAAGCTISAARASDLAFSDPARLPPPPPGAVGFPSREPDLDVQPGFRKPPPGYGEVAFYWWLGDPLARERLKWQMDQLKGKGVSGLQVNYAHSDSGGRSYGLTFTNDPPLFSEAWWDLYGWFLQEAKKRGMAVSLSDYTLGVGQGWRVDEILKEFPTIRGAVLEHTSRDFVGGQELTWEVPENTVSLTAYRTRDKVLEAGSGANLLPNLKGRILCWLAPEGNWRVIAVAARVNPYSLDPMHPLSGREYIKKFFQPFEDRNPGEAGKGLNFFFSDELDFGVHGNLWNSFFAGEFRRRKGYDLLPELAALFVDIGPRTPKIRMDYSDVLVSLEEENFFRPCFEWHYQRGMLFGCDHGGRGKEITEFGDYFRTQRWMTGTGNDQPHLAADLIKNKVNSSIVHLYERPRVWLEGFYGSGWGTSSAQLADATFRNFAHGHNLLTLHGLYYSTHGGWWEWAPPCNHFRMPYWRHMGEFLHCVERLSYLMSQGTHQCDVAVLYPVAPKEAGMKGSESVTTAFNVGSHLYRQGIDFDFLDFESLARARIEDRELRVAGEQYRALVLPAMQAVRFSTLQKAAEFFRAGGLVIAVGDLPLASERVGRDDPELDALVKEVFGLTARESAGERKLNRHSTGGVGAFVPSQEQAADLVNHAVPRDFACSAAQANGDQPAVMHRKAGAREIYLVYGAPEGSEGSFRTTGKIELWDPWTGKSRSLAALAQTKDSTRLRMPLTEKEVQLIVFSPGQATTETNGTRPDTADLVVKLEGQWDFELEPTMDNRFGDFRWPPSCEYLGAEARRFRYADETVEDPGWQDPAFDDSQWPEVTASFGPKFWKLGPLPETVDVAALEARLLGLSAVDPAVPIEIGNRKFSWQPYSFSWRWGIENDPGHQGYHGLKGQVHDEFIGLGKLARTATGTDYVKEDAGSRYYLWTSIAAGRGFDGVSVAGGMTPGAAWLNHQPLPAVPCPVRVVQGSNPLLLRYDKPSRGYFVVESGQPPSRTNAPHNMAMSWYARSDVQYFDTRPQAAHPAGWYRFVSPPGFRSMKLAARGKIQAWADGKPMKVSAGRKLPDGSVEYSAATSTAIRNPATVALRIQQDRGCYAGAALPEPVKLNCARGKIELGDWSAMGVLKFYSGGAWYRKNVNLKASSRLDRVTLDLGDLAATAEVRINGKPAGIRVAPPWRFDITDLVKNGDNRVEVLICSALGGHYSTIPTRYPGLATSGLLGPVKIVRTSSR
jgi:hypothetical protein